MSVEDMTDLAEVEAVDPPSSPMKKSKRSISPSQHRKPCDLCKARKDVLVRCQIDDTLKWHFVCPGKCWKSVSGGEIDGPEKPFYRYGGMWKNKHSGVSAKKPKQKSKLSPRPWSGNDAEYVTNDQVVYDNKLWICRRSHYSDDKMPPEAAYRYWKEVDDAVRD